MDNCEFDIPAPFSGEWADGLTARGAIEDATDIDYDSLEGEEESELLTAFEDAYYLAFAEEAERTVRALLGD